MDVHDFGDQFLVLALPRRRVYLALDPAVIGGGGDTEDLEDGLDAEAATKLRDEREAV